jgi:tRNA uridine 5-carboxymethylaminomethyl modification enzyme
LREDNADLRLREIGRKIGLVNDQDYENYINRKGIIDNEFKRLNSKKLYPSADVNNIIKKFNSSPLKKPHSLKEILKRPEISYDELVFLDPESSYMLNSEIRSQIEMEIKYEGYIKRQKEQVDKFQKFEGLTIPDGFIYDNIPGLSNEITQKLSRIRPSSVGQASRISGITPAGISVLLVYLKKYGLELAGNQN